MRATDKNGGTQTPQRGGNGSRVRISTEEVAVNRQQVWKAIGATLLVFGSHLYGQTAHSQTQAATTTRGTFVRFDVSGSSALYPAAINSAGAITGYYSDAGSLLHSFMRAPDGRVIRFDPPGATCSLSGSNVCSVSTDINPEGVISGYYQDTSGNTHGFLRARDGRFTTIDVPGSINNTQPQGINPAGTVTGGYVGTGLLSHGFLRRSNGVFTTFDPPGSSYTQAYDINPSGVITGVYRDAGGVTRGFLRSLDGNIATFDPPGDILEFPPPPPTTINAEGTVTGTYCGSSCHGFLRAPGGTLTTIDAPGDNYGTYVAGINSAGAMAGYYILADFTAQHGFLRTRDGKFITFDPPGSLITTPIGINESGTIMGSYCNATSCHGFVWTHRP
jgi:hypothetical protein